MPIQTRPSDSFTREHLLLGFSTVEFTPTLATGLPGTTVELGILASEELQKTVELLELRRGDAGTITVDREVVSFLKPSLQIETFNFKWNVAQYIFGAASSTVSAVTAAAAQAASTNVTIPTSNTFDSFVNVDHADIDETSVEVTFQTITNEAVGTGDGASGGTQGDYSLDRKIKAIGDVTSFTVGGTDETANLVSGSTPTSGQIAIEIGEEDSPTTGSGAITFGSGKIPASGAAIVATYTPSFSTTGTDIVNPTDFIFDPVLGKIRFLHAGADASPFRLAALAPGTPLNVAYTYNRKASVDFQPFTQGGGVFEGSAVIRHLPDVGSNFTYTIPSASIRIDENALTFGADDFVRGTLVLNINDAGGSDRFGTISLSSEPEQLA